MRHFNLSTIPTQRLFAALLLTGIISVGASATVLEIAKAATVNPVSSLKQSSNLPNNVSNAIRNDIAEKNQIPRGQIRVSTATAQTWRDSCLGLGTLTELCAQATVPGWRVVMTDGGRTWVYRSNANGTVIRQEGIANSQGGSLPTNVADAVIQRVARRFSVDVSDVRIIKAEARTWSNSCLERQRPNERCMGVQTPGWQVTVERTMGRREQERVYRTNSDGTIIRAEGGQGNGSDDEDNLPQVVSAAVLKDAQTRSRLSTSQINIISSERQQWPNGCLGLTEPGQFCTQAIVPGWRVTVKAGQQTYIYRTNETATFVKLETGTAQSSISPVPIPRNELPPTLPSNVLFRAISSGGFAGRTSELRLLADGRLMRVSSTGQQEVRTVSRRQLGQFQDVLEQARLSQYNGQSYPAARGSADYITVTLSTPGVNTRYADIIQNQLPESLRSVIDAWNQIAN